MSTTASFTVYKASAGSGKTYTLVKEYLAIALSESQNPFNFRHILAITFTNKAAAEMKERVISTLHALSDLEAIHPMAEDLCKTLNISRDELAERANKCLSAILHHYSDFSVGTIDSFMHRVVKAFAYDLKLPINFQVEIDEEMLLNKAIQRILGKVGLDSEITSALKELTENKTEAEKFMRIEDDLYKLSGDLLRENPALNIRKLQNLQIKDFKEIKNKIRKEIDLFVDKVKKIGRNATDLIEYQCLSTYDFYQGTRGVANLFDKCNFFEIGSSIDINSYCYKAYNDDIWYSSTASEDVKARIDSISEELSGYLDHLVNIKDSSYQKYLLQCEILKNIDAVSILNEIGRAIDEIRTEEQTVHISEFNRRVSDVVMNEPAPFVFERLGEKYRHFLIDEFQDTSILQWQNVLPLIHNGLASNYSSIIVGDPKQAIYRFRGGEVEQFSRMPKPYPEQINDLQKERYSLIQHFHKENNLTVNRRSLSNIIDFNNRFYDYLNRQCLPESLQQVYNGHAQEHVADKNGGYVGIKLLKFEKDQKRDEKNEILFSEISETIVELIHNNNLTLREIAVLVRDNRSGSDLASYLIQNNIPVISGESLLLMYDADVKMILAWMKVISGYQISLYLFEILEILFKQGKTEFRSESEMIKNFSLHPSEPEYWINTLNIKLDIEKLRLIPITEFAYEICRAFNYSVNKNTYLQFFLEFIWNVAKNKSADIPVFLETWNEKADSLSITMPEDAEAVRVLTIHKSKGLQFPVVILSAFENKSKKQESKWLDNEGMLPEPLSTFKFQLSKKMLETDIKNHVIDAQQKTVLDKLNLLYVGTTRPEKALFIISAYNDKPQKDKEEYDWETMLNSFIINETGFSSHKSGIFELGNKDFIKSTETKNATNAYSIEDYKTAIWRNKIKISRNKSLTQSIKNENNAQFKGNLFHDFFAKIQSLEDVHIQINKYRTEGLISHAEVEELQTMSIQLFSNSEINNLFQNAVAIFNEHNLLIDSMQYIRPDKVFKLEKEIVVVDFKTGIMRDLDVKQISRYVKALREVYILPCRGILVYLSEDLRLVDVE